MTQNPKHLQCVEEWRSWQCLDNFTNGLELLCVIGFNWTGIMVRKCMVRFLLQSLSLQIIFQHWKMVERFYKYLFDMAIFRYQSKPIRHMDEAEGRLQTRIQLLQSINMIVFVRVSWPANISTDPGAAQPHPSSDKKKITRIMLIIRCCGSWRWWPCHPFSQQTGGPSGVTIVTTEHRFHYCQESVAGVWVPGAAAWTGVRMRRPGHDRSQVLSPSLELNLDTCVHPHLHIYHSDYHSDRFISVQSSRSDLKLKSYSCQ